jgi:hypothetical protein
VYIYIYIYILHTHTHTHTHTRARAHTHTHKLTHRSTPIYTQLPLLAQRKPLTSSAPRYVCVCMCVRVFVCVCLCVRVCEETSDVLRSQGKTALDKCLAKYAQFDKIIARLAKSS